MGGAISPSAGCSNFPASSSNERSTGSGLWRASWNPTFCSRIEIHVEKEIRMKRLQRGSFAVLREAVLSGEVERSKVPSLTGYEKRAPRLVTAGLVERGMLTATTHRASLGLAFPADVAERWSSNLYPANAGSRP